MAREEELPLSFEKAQKLGTAASFPSVGCLSLRANMDPANYPEVLAVVPLPSATERRRREVMLARVMLVAIDIVLAGEPLGWRRPAI